MATITGGARDLRLGAVVLNPCGAADAMTQARAAERLGYDAVSFTHVAGPDAPLLMAAAAVTTSSIHLTAGVLPIFTRTPATMAQTAASLHDLSGGRASLGLGLSHALVVEQWHGQEIGPPVAAMRDYLVTMRAILRGEAPPPGGRFPSNFALSGIRPARDFPLLVGALSPGMLRLAGEIADGVALWLCDPAYVRDVVVPCVHEGRAKAGLPLEGFEIAATIPTVVGDDVAGLRESQARSMLHNVRLPFYRAVLERGGHGEALAAFDEAASFDELFADPDPAPLRLLAQSGIVGDLAAIGTLAAVRQRLAEYHHAGLTLATLAPVRPRDHVATLAALAPAAAA